MPASQPDGVDAGLGPAVAEPAPGSTWETAPLPPGLPPGYQPPEGSPPPTDGAQTIPWEDAGDRNEPRKLALTLWKLLTEPSATFAVVGDGESLLRPILFGMFVAVVAQLSALVQQGLVHSAVADSLFRALSTATGGALAAPSTSSGTSAIGSRIFSLVVAPLLYPVGLVIASAVTHGLLTLFGGANRSFVVTLRTLAYASAPSVLSAVPILGSVTAWVWTLVLQAVGLYAAHRTSGGRAAAAVLVPIAALAVCGVGMIALLLVGLRSALPLPANDADGCIAEGVSCSPSLRTSTVTAAPIGNDTRKPDSRRVG